MLKENSGSIRVFLPNLIDWPGWHSLTHSSRERSFFLFTMLRILSDQLSRDEREAYEFAFSQGKSSLQKAGYCSALIGQNWADEDFADRAHLTASGGQKMASRHRTGNPIDGECSSVISQRPRRNWVLREGKRC